MTTEMTPARYTHLLERAVITASAATEEVTERAAQYKTARDDATAALTRWQEEVCRAMDLPLNTRLDDVLAGIQQFSSSDSALRDSTFQLDQIADVLEELPPLDTDPVGLRRHGKEDLIRVLARIFEIVTPTGPEQDSNARD